MMIFCVYKVIKAEVLGEENVNSFEKRYKVKVLKNYKVSTLYRLVSHLWYPSFNIHNNYIPSFKKVK